MALMFQGAKYTEHLVFNHLRISIIIQCYKRKYCWVKAEANETWADVNTDLENMHRTL